MAKPDPWKRYLEAGAAFTELTRERAEEIVKDLVKAGEVRRKEAGKRVDELLERSRKNTEEVLALVRREVATQLRALGLEDLANRASGAGGAGARPDPNAGTEKAAAAARAAAGGGKAAGTTGAAGTTAAAQKGVATKASPATKRPAAKKAAKQSPAKKVAAKKAPVGKKAAAAKKSPAAKKSS